MKRRAFVRKGTLLGAALITGPFLGLGKYKTAKVMDRIGLTTVVFRDRFKASVPKEFTLTNELTLLDVPEYFSDRFGIKQLEYWGRHFESMDPDYLMQIKRNIRKNKCRLVDIQVDAKNDLSDPDESKRNEAIAEMKEWIDVAQILDCPFVRLSSMKKSYDMAISSIKEVDEYASKRGVKTLVENHFDLFSDPDIHQRTLEDVASENLGLLADFGNYPDTVDRYAALAKIAPSCRFVSAKTSEFDSTLQHVSFDFGRCLDIFEEAGYRGIYSLEQWGKPNENYDYEKMVDWMIDQVKDRVGV